MREYFIHIGLVRIVSIGLAIADILLDSGSSADAPRAKLMDRDVESVERVQLRVLLDD